MPYPGSTDTLTLTVTPYAADTSATVHLDGPGGATLNPTASSTDGKHTWTASPIYTAAGTWVATWTVTGTGAGIVTEQIWVSAVPSAAARVAWRPDVWKVADYVPGRTLVAAVDGYGNAIATFDSTTHPTGDQVQRLVTDGCAWVATRCGTLDASLYDMGTAVAAVYAAAQVERGYPDANRDPQVADQLWQQAQAMREDLAKANAAITGVEPEDPAAHLVPYYSFPGSVSWGDLDFY